MDKHNMVHQHNGMLFGLERKAILAAATRWMKPEDVVLSETSQPQEDTDCDSAHPKYLEKSSSWRQEVEWWVRGMRKRLTGAVSVRKEENVLEVDGGDGSAQCECPHPRTAHLQKVQVVNLYCVDVTTIKKKSERQQRNRLKMNTVKRLSSRKFPTPSLLLCSWWRENVAASSF